MNKFLHFTAIVAALSTRALSQSYGEEQRVTYESPVPSGWIVTALHDAGRDTPNWRNVAKTLTYIGGARTGAILRVRSENPVPVGWVVTETHDEGKGTRHWRRVGMTIRHVGGERRGTCLEVHHESPVPDGWVVYESPGAGRRTKTIRCASER